MGDLISDFVREMDAIEKEPFVNQKQRLQSLKEEMVDYKVSDQYPIETIHRIEKVLELENSFVTGCINGGEWNKKEFIEQVNALNPQ